jgi:hypothetical protein
MTRVSQDKKEGAELRHLHIRARLLLIALDYYFYYA